MKNSNRKASSENTRQILALLLVTSMLAACSSSSTSTTTLIGDSDTDGEVTEGSGADGEVTNGSEADGEVTNGSETDSEVTGGEATDGGTDSPIELTPVVRAPANAQILITESLELIGSVTYDPALQDTPSVEWITLSGPGNANFVDRSSATTSVSFDESGTYGLEIKASNGSYESADQMSVVVSAEAFNQSPSVNVGADETLNIDSTLNLSATIGDDGLPTNTLTGSWTKVEGAGEVTFGESTAFSTTASFSASGRYLVRFTASDGQASTSDDLYVDVTESPVVITDDNVNAANNWQAVTTSDGSLAQARHEAGAVAYQGKLYLMGGRSIREVNRYDPVTNKWENLGSTEFEVSHFQPVVYGGKIYVLGSLDCCYPSETVIASIQIFDPVSNTWSQGSDLPQNRLRGSAGAVVYNNKIYLVGGSTNGHDGGMVNWFDEYDPASDTWTTLPDAPSKRDHFSAALVGNKLVAAGGRQTDYPATFLNLVPAVDVYDFTTGSWSAGATIPTKRAGAMTVSYGDEAILIGGEIDTGTASLNVVEAYNVKTNTWRTLDSISTARHSGGAAIVGGAIHVVSGNTTTGGGNEVQTHEKLNLD